MSQSKAPPPGGPLFTIEGLGVELPGGGAILKDVRLSVAAGEAVVIAGPSGSGKSTLLRALFDAGALAAEGYRVDPGKIHGDSELGLVPQRGAPFDHLDVAGNLRLALRHAKRGAAADDDAVRRWLEAVDLDPRWAVERRPVSALSGGQAQRLAVARALASGRRVLFFDEPSAALDPVRVRSLAVQLRRLCDEQGTAVVVVTHDPDFAAAVGDRLFILDGGLLGEVALPPRRGSGVRSGDAHLDARRVVEAALIGPRDAPAPAGGRTGLALGRRLREALAPFDVLVRAPLALPAHAMRHPRELAHVLGVALRQSLLRPWLFYLVVAFLLGFTVLYVLASFGGEFGPEEAIRIVRGLPLLALTPPLTAFLFVAASGNAVNAWMGGLRFSGQVTALEALGVGRVRYLWAPSFLALTLASLIVAVTFAAGFLAGELVLCHLYGMADPLPVLTGDLFDPPPDRAPYRVRAAGLVLVYAVGCAADAIGRADGPKPAADSVTRAMTRSVVACTLWVVLWELGSLLLLRALREGA